MNNFILIMGIPSYYRKLVGSVGGLLYKTKPGTLVASGAKWLLMDYNCLIYHVLRDKKRAEYPHEESIERDRWIERLYDDIVRYTLHVIRGAGAENVYIAIDGVVPMAKIRQQRMRRFKSAAAASTGFDTNAITPGTDFMRGLRISLQEMIHDNRKDDKWILSSADEPGEGEHKILHHLRHLNENSSSSHDNRPFIVYGLDGDLIVLLLWIQALGITGDSSIWLYREDVDDESGSDDKHCWFSIDRLRDYLADSEKVDIREYCAAMMLLGNDFLPTSITFKIKDGGHNFLLGWLKTSLERGEHFLDKEGQLIMPAWMRLFRQLASAEERRFIEAIQKKWKTVAKKPEEEQPLEWREEKVFLKNPLADADVLELREDWREIYAQHIFHTVPGCEQPIVSNAVDAYFKTMYWIVDYYTGKRVDNTWAYSWLMPPLWKDIAVAKGVYTVPLISEEFVELEPEEQLALVLPEKSWWLIPRTHRAAGFMKAAPEFFPGKFKYESIGKRFNWESEPLIPIPSISQLRAITIG